MFATLSTTLEKELGWSDERLKQSSALDFGCGPGHLAFHLSGKMKSVTGIDNSRYMIDILEKEATKQGLTNVKGLHLDLNDDSVQQVQEKFDLITVSFSLHHATRYENSPEMFIRNFSRLLNPKGVLAIYDSDESGFEEETFKFQNLSDMFKKYGLTQTRLAVDFKDSFGVPDEEFDIMCCYAVRD